MCLIYTILFCTSQGTNWKVACILLEHLIRILCQTTLFALHYMHNFTYVQADIEATLSLSSDTLF